MLRRQTSQCTVGMFTRQCVLNPRWACVFVVAVAPLVAGCAGNPTTQAVPTRITLTASRLAPNPGAKWQHTRTVTVTCGAHPSIRGADQVPAKGLCAALADYIPRPIPKCSFGPPSAGPAGDPTLRLWITGTVRGQPVHLRFGLGTWCNLTPKQAPG